MEWSPALNLSETPVSVPLMIPHRQTKSTKFFCFKINRGYGSASVFITYSVSAGFLDYIRQTRRALEWLVL